MRLIKIISPTFVKVCMIFVPVWTQDAIEWTSLPKCQPVRVIAHSNLFVVIVIHSYILLIKY